MSVKAMQIAVQIVFSSNVAATMRQMQTQLNSVHTQVNRITNSFHGMKTAIDALGLGIAVHRLERLATTSYEAAGRIGHQKVVAENVGIPEEVVKTYKTQAFDIASRIPQVTPDQVMETATELRASIGDEETKKFLEKMVRIGVVMGNLADKDFNPNDLQKMAKALEAMGLVKADKPEVFAKALDDITKTIEFTKGALDINQILQFARQGASIVPGMTDSEKFGMMPYLMQEMGGAKAGTALTSFYQQFMKPQSMTKETVKTLTDIGVIDKNKAILNHGKLQNVEAVNDLDMLMHEPLRFMHEIHEKMTKMGLSEDKQKQLIIGLLFNRQNVGRQEMSVVQGWANVMRDEGFWKNAPNLQKSSENVIQHDPLAGIKGLSNSFIYLAQSFEDSVPKINEYILSFGKKVRDFGDYIKANPEAADNLIKIVGAIGALLAVVVAIKTVAFIGGALFSLSRVFGLIAAARFATGIGLLIGLVELVAHFSPDTRSEKQKFVEDKTKDWYQEHIFNPLSLTDWGNWWNGKGQKGKMPDFGKDWDTSAAIPPPRQEASPVIEGNVTLDGYHVGKITGGIIGRQLGTPVAGGYGGLDTTNYPMQLGVQP